MKEALQEGEISSGSGLNQETTIKNEGETRWISHYGTLLGIVSLFSSLIDVIEMIKEDGTSFDQKDETLFFIKYTQSFEFIFILNLMKKVLGINHDLSQALQRSEQDIVNAMKLVNVQKEVASDKGQWFRFFVR